VLRVCVCVRVCVRECACACTGARMQEHTNPHHGTLCAHPRFSQHALSSSCIYMPSQHTHVHTHVQPKTCMPLAVHGTMHVYACVRVRMCTCGMLAHAPANLACTMPIMALRAGTSLFQSSAA